MEDQDKAGSKPSDATDTEEHTEAISFVERDPVLVVESHGASATACRSSSSFGYGATLKGSGDDRTDVFRISGGHCGETTSDVAKDNVSTSMECMPMTKKTESYSDQSVKINTYESLDIEGGMLVNEGLHLQTESQPVMVPSTEEQFQSEKIFLAHTGPVTGYGLPLKAESPSRNELLASTNVEGDTSGIGQLEHRSCGLSQITRESPAQVNGVEKTIDDASCEEAERACNNDGDIARVRIDNIPDTANNTGTSNAEVSKSCSSNMIFSETEKGLVEIGSYGAQIFGENPTQNGELGLTVGDVSYKLAEAAYWQVRNTVASSNVEGDKSGNGVGPVEHRSCDLSQITREGPVQVNGVEKTIDDASCEEAERACNKDGDIACAMTDSIPDTANNTGTSNAEVSKSCASNLIFSETANGVAEIGSYGPQMFWENPTQDGEPGLTIGDVSYKQAEAASGKVRETAASSNVEGDKIGNGAGPLEHRSCGLSQITRESPAQVNGVEKTIDDALCEEAERACNNDGDYGCAKIDNIPDTANNTGTSNAEVSKSCASNMIFMETANGVAEIGSYGPQTFGENPIQDGEPGLTAGNVSYKQAESASGKVRHTVASELTTSVYNKNNLEGFTAESSGTTVPDTISFDPNMSETSNDELPSVELGIATAVIDGGFEFHTKQDVVQTSSENGVEEELVKQAAIKTCAKHGREEELTNQDPVRTCSEHDVEEGAEKQDTIKTYVEHDSEVEPAKQDDESKKQDDKPTNQDEVQISLKYGGGEELVGQKVTKKFGRRNYMGEVAGFDKETSWYKVTYEDGDVEDLEWDELKPLLLQLKGGDSEIRKRKSHSRLGIQRRSFKRVRRPNDSRLSRAMECLREEKGTPVETSDRKENEKSGLHTEYISVMDSGEKLSSPTRTAKRRHSEQSIESSKKRKVEEEAYEEHDRASGSRIGNKLIKESSPPTESNLNENRVSTRRNSGSSAKNLEAVSVVNADIGISIPNSYHKAKAENHESSDQKGPPKGGGISLIGRKTKKFFGGHVYIGEVIDYDYKAQYYKVKYEDGDEEELEWSELGPTLVPSEHKPLSFKSMLRARNMASRSTVKELSTAINKNAANLKEVLFAEEGKSALSKQQKPSSFLEEVKAGAHEKEKFSRQLVTPVESIRPIPSLPLPLSVARFASAGDADIHEYFGWGEVIGFEKAKCPELGAAKLLPTSSPIVHLAASQHHLAAITAAGQVWVWRNRHGNIHTRCNEWEHMASLGEKGIVLVDIAGPDLDRASGGYEANQEDQVPDPFYLVAVGADGQDFILQGSQPQEIVRTSQLSDEPQHLSLEGALSQLGYSSEGNMGRIVQVSVGTVEAPDESPFIGYITDTDHVYIRSATKDYMEEVNLVSGYTGKPIKIQCGRVYHAIIMTDDGRAWTWGRGYYPGLNTFGSSGFLAATCQSAVGTLVGRKVIDVGCYGEDFIALTNDGDVHQWTHAVPNPATGVYNVPATPLYGHGPCIPHGDKLKQVSIGAGICAGITESGKVHTWRTAMKGGLIGILVPEKEALTPLGHEENRKDTAIVSLGNRIATKVICVAGSLIVVVKKKARGRMGRRKKQQTTNTESGLEGQS